MTTSREGFILFSEKEIYSLERKFRYIVLELVDSVGYYAVIGTSQEVLTSTYLDKFGKLTKYLQDEFSIYSKIITHGYTTYIVFLKD